MAWVHRSPHKQRCFINQNGYFYRPSNNYVSPFTYFYNQTKSESRLSGKRTCKQHKVFSIKPAKNTVIRSRPKEICKNTNTSLILLRGSPHKVCWNGRKNLEAADICNEKTWRTQSLMQTSSLRYLISFLISSFLPAVGNKIFAFRAETFFAEASKLN